MVQPDEFRIRHMIEAGDRAVGFAAARSRTDLDSDEMAALLAISHKRVQQPVSGGS